MSEISLYIDSHLGGKRAKRIFSRRMWMVFCFGLNQRVPWEQNIRYIYLPSLQLSIIMWLSHFLTSFSSHRIRYLFPKNRVTSMFIPKVRLWIYTVCTQGIYKAIDSGHDVCAIFLDVSKAFDKVWHEGLIFKLKQIGICDNLLLLLINNLDSRSQKVVLNGTSSSLCSTSAGVPQGSILGPLLLLVYVNEIKHNILIL